jgi:hypothetical protein
MCSLLRFNSTLSGLQPRTVPLATRLLSSVPRRWGPVINVVRRSNPARGSALPRAAGHAHSHHELTRTRESIGHTTPLCCLQIS